MGNNAKEPAIRFHGFTDAWEQRKFVETFDFLPNNSLSRAQLTYENGTVKNVHYGDVLIKFGELLDVGKEELPYLIDDSLIKNYSSAVLKNGDVVIADAAEDETVGKCSEIKGIKDEKILSGLHTIPVRPRFEFENGYLGYFMNSHSYHDQLLPLIQGTKVSSISKKVLENTVISYPASSSEQEKIATFFENLTNLITLHQRKYEKLKNIKQAMLEKMFPKNGEQVPEIRFKGFTDAWEQRKLGECLSEITYGFTNPMSDTEDGPWKITAKDIVDGNINYSSARHTSQREYENLTKKSKPLVGDLLLTKDGTLGRTAIVNSENICINQSVALLRFNQKCSVQYVKTLLDTPWYQRQMLDDAGGGTIKHIYITKIDKMSIPIPSMSEQERLVRFFGNLDNLITLHQRKLEKLKNIKKSMLNEMFV